ncbi:MAG: hypothetical protein U0625_00220 [Phycisphaerales bacterium]
MSANGPARPKFSPLWIFAAAIIATLVGCIVLVLGLNYLAAEHGRRIMESTAPPAPSPLSAPEIARKDRAALVELLRRATELSRKLQQDYFDSIVDAGILGIRDLERIQKDEAMAETREIVRRAHAAIDRHREAMAALRTRARDIVADSGLSPESMKQALGLFEEQMADRAELQAQSLVLELRTLDAISDLVEYLGAHRDEWQIRDGELDWKVGRVPEGYQEVERRLRAANLEQREFIKRDAEELQRLRERFEERSP